MPTYSKKQNGFTLIELLVVIIIIGALSGVLLGVINTGGVRAKGRDAQRKADLNTLRLALENYYAEFRVYPTSDAAITVWDDLSSANPNVYTLLGNNGYLDDPPSDPSGDTNPVADDSPCLSADYNRYNYWSDGDSYTITAIMELEASAEDNPCPNNASFGDAPNTCLANYATLGRCYFVRNP